MASPKKISARILIIDDDEDDYFITSEYIRQIEEYDLVIDWCYKFNEAVKLLKDHAYDIYFVDYRLGAKTGLDFFTGSGKFKGRRTNCVVNRKREQGS